MGPILPVRKTPALTIVAACIRAETEAGPVIASGSHSCKGNCADFPIGPPKKSNAVGSRSPRRARFAEDQSESRRSFPYRNRSEEHTSELQSRSDIVCRLLLEKKK